MVDDTKFISLWMNHMFSRTSNVAKDDSMLPELKAEPMA